MSNPRWTNHEEWLEFIRTHPPPPYPGQQEPALLCIPSIPQHQVLMPWTHHQPPHQLHATPGMHLLASTSISAPQHQQHFTPTPGPPVSHVGPHVHTLNANPSHPMFRRVDQNREEISNEQAKIRAEVRRGHAAGRYQGKGIRGRYNHHRHQPYEKRRQPVVNLSTLPSPPPLPDEVKLRLAMQLLERAQEQEQKIVKSEGRHGC